MYIDTVKDLNKKMFYSLPRLQFAEASDNWRHCKSPQVTKVLQQLANEWTYLRWHTLMDSWGNFYTTSSVQTVQKFSDVEAEAERRESLNSNP